MYKISIDSGKDNLMSFRQGDIVKAQKFTGNDIRMSLLEVVKVDDTSFWGTLIDGSAPVADMAFIRMDNTQDDDRAGMIILSATGSDTPFIDVAFNRKTKSRLGRLDGISDASFPTIGGYGLYSDNVYLKGELILSSGENVSDKFDSQASDLADKAFQSDLDNTDLIVSNQSALIQANSEGILLKASQTSLNTTNGNVSTNSSAIGVNATNINLRVVKNDVINQINVSTEGILIAADNIQISGSTTFSSGYNPSEKETPAGAQDKANTAESNAATDATNKVTALSNTLGDVAYLDLVEEAQLGTTVIEGGFIKADLIDVDTLIVRNLKTSTTGQRVEMTGTGKNMEFYDEYNVNRVLIDDYLFSQLGVDHAGIAMVDGVISMQSSNATGSIVLIDGRVAVSNSVYFDDSVADAVAIPNSVFLRESNGKLAFRDSSGDIHNLY